MGDIGFQLGSPVAAAAGLRTDATSDSMGGGLCSHSRTHSLRTKAGDFPPGEDEREDDGWIWPFNANNMNDTRGRVVKGEAEAPFLNQIGYGGNSIRVWEWNDRLR